MMLSQEKPDALIEARAAKLVEQQKQKAQAERISERPRRTDRRNIKNGGKIRVRPALKWE